MAEPVGEPMIPCCAHCGCTDERTGHDDTCSKGCNDVAEEMADWRDARLIAYALSVLGDHGPHTAYTRAQISHCRARWMTANPGIAPSMKEG